MRADIVAESVRETFPAVAVRQSAFGVSVSIDGVGRVYVERSMDGDEWRVTFGTTAVNRDAREMPNYVAGIATLAAVAAHCERLVRGED